MAVPDFQTLMLPLLETAAKGRRSVKECAPVIAAQFSLSEDDLAQMLPSRRQSTFINRLHWARVYLAKAGLLTMVKRGVFEVSEDGARVLADAPPKIDMRFLERFEAYRVWRQADEAADDARGHVSETAVQPSVDLETPEERIAAAQKEINDSLASDILDRLLNGSPTFFESAVVKLLTAMGYGRGRDRAGQRIGRSGDGGIDGVINEDALGLDAVYVQAKRYATDNTVGRPAIQQFVGSLTGEGAGKGVFVTTSGFSAEAKRYVDKIDKRIVLIDGQKLARLMIAHGVGVRPVDTIILSEIDENFFSDE